MVVVVVVVVLVLMAAMCGVTALHQDEHSRSASSSKYGWISATPWSQMVVPPAVDTLNDDGAVSSPSCWLQGGGSRDARRDMLAAACGENGGWMAGWLGARMTAWGDMGCEQSLDAGRATAKAGVM